MGSSVVLVPSSSLNPHHCVTRLHGLPEQTFQCMYLYLGDTLHRHLESGLYILIAVGHSVANLVEHSLSGNASTSSLVVALFLPRIFSVPRVFMS